MVEDSCGVTKRRQAADQGDWGSGPKMCTNYAHDECRVADVSHRKRLQFSSVFSKRPQLIPIWKL